MKKILLKTSWIDDNLGMYPPPWRVLLHGGGEDDDWEPIKHGDEETCRQFMAILLSMGMPFTGGMRLCTPDGEVDNQVPAGPKH